MEFEYDPNKSESNKEKHGINFKDAQALWLDAYRLEIQAKSDDEPRFALITELNQNLWTAFYTIRETRIRLISVRHSRKREKELYYES